MIGKWRFYSMWILAVVILASFGMCEIAKADGCNAAIQSGMNEGSIIATGKDGDSGFVRVDMHYYRNWPYRAKLGLTACIMKKYNATTVYVMSESNKLIGRLNGSGYTEW
jgi:hypothetical protein